MSDFFKSLLREVGAPQPPNQVSPVNEASVLDGIEQGLVTINKDFTIVKVNKFAENLTGLSNETSKGRDFLETFVLFDINKNIIEKSMFPIDSSSTKLYGFSEDNIYLRKTDQNLVPINFKFTPIISSDGKINSFLFAFFETPGEKAAQLPNKVMLESFDKLETLLFENAESSSRRIIHFYENLELLYKLSAGEIPGLLSNFDVGDSVRRVIAQREGLSYDYGVQLINSTPLSPNMPIKTNKYVFEKAIEKVIELGIFIASRSSNKFVIVSTGLSPENIFVFIKATAFDNFPWEKAQELVKPFFGDLSSEEKLLQASGLEGYLAENLLKSKGFDGGIIGQKFDDGVNNPQIILTVALPYATNNPPEEQQ